MIDYNVIKEKCCRFYDESILPRYLREHYELEDCGYELESFLNEMNLSLQEYKRYILMYSYGEGLDYLEKAYNTIDTIPEFRKLSPQELDFVMNCSQKRHSEIKQDCQLLIPSPTQEVNNL